MSINNVYQKLENSIIECERGVIEAEAHKHHLKGMAGGFRLALQVLYDEGLTPVETKNMVIPFKSKDEQ